MQGKYQLNRKAVDEHEAVSKRPRVTAEISTLLETEDLSAKLEFENNTVKKFIEAFQEISRNNTSTTLGPKMQAWRLKKLDRIQQTIDEGMKICELRKQLSELLNEYKSNKELKEESWSDATWCSNKWAGPVSTLVTCNNDLQIRVLGMQKLREMIDEKRADIISRAEKLQTEIKNLGVSFI